MKHVTFIVESAPRLLVHLASLAALGAALGACVVPAARYEEAVSAAEVEQDGHRRTLALLYATEQKLSQVEAQLRDQEKRSADRDQLIAEAQLQSSVAATERDSASGLVEQLRGELARAGDHMSSFATQRNDLAGQLEAAQARVARLGAAAERLDELGRVVRDLTLLLGEGLAVGEIDLEIKDGKPLVTIPSERVWKRGTNELTPEAKKMLEAMGKLASRHPRVRFELSEAGARGDTSMRLLPLVEVLTAQGITGDRASIPAPDPSAAGSAAPPAVPPATTAAPAAAPAVDTKLQIALEIAAP
jgi:hypothetical protein